MRHWLVIACALFVGAVAPARAWCEATCLAPAEQSQSHCSTHDPVDATTAISATVIDDCPVIESARPSVPGRLEVAHVVIHGYVPHGATRTSVAPSFARPHSATTVFERCTPLRI